MKTIYQQAYLSQLNQIRGSDHSAQLKILQMEALIHKIKTKSIYTAQLPHRNKSHEDTISTFMTIQNPQVINDQDIHILQKKILQKRELKIQLNEQLEEIQQELEAVEKTVMTKQQIQNTIRLKIDRKRMQIETAAYQQKMYGNKPTKNKTFSGFSDKFRSFFG